MNPKFNLENIPQDQEPNEKTKEELKQEMFQELIKHDLGKGEEFSNLENSEERRDLINKHIDDVLDLYFEKSEKDEKDYIIMIKRLSLTKRGLNLERLPTTDEVIDIDRSWNQEQINKILNGINKSKTGIDDINLQLLAGTFISSINKEDEKEDTVSDLFANGVVNLIKDGEKIDGDIDRLLDFTANNIQMTHLDARLNLISAHINNPGQVSRKTAHQLIGFQSTFGAGLISRYEDLYKNNLNNPNKILKIIDILESIHVEDFFLELDSAAQDETKHVLKEIKNNNKNYFIDKRLDSLNFFNDTKPRKNRVLDFQQEHDDSDLRDKEVNPLETASFSNEEYKNEFIKESIYTKTSPKYATIYNPYGKVDSFFEINSDEKENLRVEDLIEKEGVSFWKEKSEDEQEMIINNYKNMLDVDFKEDIEKSFNIKLEDFSFREQLQFVNFLSFKSISEVEELKGFLNKGDDISKHNRIKTFLSLEQNNEIGEHILNIGNNVEEINADLIFSKYSEIADIAENVHKNLEDLFKKDKNFSPEELNKISTKLIEKSNKLLLNFSTKIKEGKNIKEEEINKSLEEFKIDLAFIASIFTSLKKEGNREDIDFEDMKGISFEKIKAKDLNKEDVIKITNIYKNNYANIPEFQEKILNKFKETLEKENVEFYILRKEKEIIIFSAFEQINKDTKFATAFNADPNLKGSNMANLYIEKIFNQLTEDFNIECECMSSSKLATNQISSKYKLSAKELLTNYKNTGVNLLLAERPKKSDEKEFIYQNMADEEIIALTQDEYSLDDNNFVLKFKKESPEYKETLTTLLNENKFKMSNYVFEGEDVYCAFEK